MNRTTKKRMWNYSPSLWLFRLLKNEVISASLQQAKNELKQTGVTGSIAANNVIHSETKSVACISIMVVAFCPKAVYIFSSSPICLPECRFILEIHTFKKKKKDTQTQNIQNKVANWWPAHAKCMLMSGKYHDSEASEVFSSAAGINVHKIQTSYEYTSLIKLFYIHGETFQWYSVEFNSHYKLWLLHSD